MIDDTILSINFKVKSIYYAIEYVGTNIGKPIVILDLHGCTRKCKWCYKNERNYFDGIKGYINLDIEDILNNVSEYNSTNIKITGGEPTEQNNLYELVKTLKLIGYKVTLETNGERDDKAFEIVDALIVDIKPYSAGKLTELERIDELKARYHNLILTGTIQTQADIDYFQSNFRVDDLWLFKEEKLGRSEYILERLMLNDNWRISFRTDKLAGIDFNKIYKKIYGD